jgi:hypothetical protein
MNLQEQISKLILEQTQGIEGFVDEIDSKFNLSDELKENLIKSIQNSDCKKIEFANFNIPAMGLAVHNGVLINQNLLKEKLEEVLFIIFHEIAHQYQFKKYGERKMYECYIGDITLDEAVDFMKKTEEVADEFGFRKIRELQKKDLIKKDYNPPKNNKMMTPYFVKQMMSNFRNIMRSKNIDSPDKVSEFLYNMTKNRL